MMRIEIAGAGAGKTTNLAKKIVANHKKMDPSKYIYCVSYTNSSVEKISSMLKGYYDSIPNNIVVTTIHSFFYNELIKPFHYLLYEEHYSKVSNSTLPNKVQFRNSKLKNFRSKGYLHVDDFTKYAKYVVCGKSNDKKITKKKREKVKKFLSTYIGSVFVDEAQDIDKYTKEVLIELNNMNLFIEIIGDPNQDLRGHEQLDKLVKEYPDIVVYNNICLRSPQTHLDFSNLFISEYQRQYNEKKATGEINYVFQTDLNNVKGLCEDYDLAYIYQKNKYFNTQSPSKNELVYEEIKFLIDRYSPEIKYQNKVLQIASKITTYLFRYVNQGISVEKAINKIFPYGALLPKDYKGLEEVMYRSLGSDQENRIKISSIQSIKGLDEEKCLFVVTSQFIPYLKQDRNKDSIRMKSHLYVALTRAKSKLTILICKDVEEKYRKEDIMDLFDKYGITALS